MKHVEGLVDLVCFEPESAYEQVALGDSGRCWGKLRQSG